MHSFRKKRKIGKHYETRDLGQRKNKKQGSATCGIWAVSSRLGFYDGESVGGNAAPDERSLISTSVHNVVAACALVGLVGHEGDVLRITSRIFLYYIFVGGMLGLLVVKSAFPSYRANS